jgi:hypothetical protein
MTNEQIIYLVAGSSALLGLTAYVTLILVPAVRAYSGVWQRIAAGFLTLYVVAGVMLLGVAGGAAIVWFWDRYGI